MNERKLALLAWNETLATGAASCREQLGLDIRAAKAVTMPIRIEGERIAGVRGVMVRPSRI
ncbi:hypothetical protein [Azospirillum tabaci]|uniref:hypothetical protein n=1 Tax=Azospirillum tabaci TaxID=2752310 RepID=UPI001660B232|nr:hypothetical protein [Azospirillum tabaci]